MRLYYECTNRSLEAFEAIKIYVDAQPLTGHFHHYT
jgi:hypothetical protein